MHDRAHPLLLLLWLSLATALVACAAPSAGSRPTGLVEDSPIGPRQPYALVLGTAQDGGLPQIGCENVCCRAAYADPDRRRLVTSVLIVDPRTGKRFLLDATPDLPEQVEHCRGLPPNRDARIAAATGSGAMGRPPLFDGIFPTHAHLGHYAGLAFLGREAYGSRATPVHASERMSRYLTSNGPWSLLVDDGAIELVPLADGQTVELGPELTLRAIRVPHREEFTDAYAFLVRGPQRALLYLPDIDKWERWSTPIEELIAAVDVALLDGTFFDGSELPERDMQEIAHPAIVESLTRFATLPAAERTKVVFTHLNHSNPAADPASEEARAVDRAGMRLARERQRFGL